MGGVGIVSTFSKNETKHKKKKKIDCYALYVHMYLSVTKTARKFGGKGAIRGGDMAEGSTRIRRSKLVASVRSNIIRRRLANRNRDAVRRAKLMRRYFICFLLSPIQNSCFIFFKPYALETK